jgi:hypothetical protein
LLHETLMVGKVQTRPQQRSSWIVPAWLPFPASLRRPLVRVRPPAQGCARALLERFPFRTWRAQGRPGTLTLAARTLTIGGLAQLAPEFFPERLRWPRRPIASDHFSGPLERTTFGGVIADADNDIPMERACGGGTRRLQRMAHGCGQIVGMVVDRHENLQPAPKGGHQAARPGLVGARSSLA